jgi:hypothetical protein
MLKGVGHRLTLCLKFEENTSFLELSQAAALPVSY